MALTRGLLGGRLACARRQAGLSYQDVASYLDLPREAVASMETGQHSIDIPTLHRLADLYGLEVHDFLQEPPLSEPEAAPAIPAALRISGLSPKDFYTIAAVQRFTRNLDALQRLLAERGLDDGPLPSAVRVP